MGLLEALLLVCCIVSLSAAPPKENIASPCPDLFKYGSVSTPGSYEATLTVGTPHDLNGVWIRLVFNRAVKEITANQGFESVKKDQKGDDYLIKNPNLVLKGGKQENVKITIKYDGDEIPSLKEFRINAVTVCPNSQVKYFLGDKQSEEYLESVTTPPKQPQEPNFKCGSVADSSKISPPWENALFVDINGTNKYVCDATLVSERYFITAAHCVTYLNSKYPIPKEKIRIFFGSYEAHPVSKVTIYPGYNPTNLLNDIALFELEKPVQLSDTIRPVCLPNTKPSSKDGIIAGFLNIDRVSVKAQEISRDQCLKKLPNLRSLLTNTICADYSEGVPKACIGQSGSSFATKSGPANTYELKGVIVAGAVLQGKKECKEGTTVVLADISEYSNWIKDTIF